MEPGYLLLALVLFQLKHYLADFQWQTIWMVAGKGAYTGMGGVAHAGLHAALSIPVLMVTGCTPMTILALAVAEFVVHLNIDWAKARLELRWNLTPDKRGYWQLFGLDQLAHQLTYIGMLAVAGMTI